MEHGGARRIRAHETLGVSTMNKTSKRLVRRTATIVMVLALAGCGDASQSGSPTTTAPTRTTATVTLSPTTVVSSTTGASDDSQIRAAFVAFFNGVDRNVDKKVALLQDGERYRQMLVDADSNAQFQQLHATVRTVRLATDAECTATGASSPCAIVTFDLLLGSFPALAAHDGLAVRVDGAWKVGAKAWCDVVAIGGETCPS